MSSDESWDDRVRRRRWPFFRDFFGDPEEFLRDIDRQFEEEFQKLGENAPRDLVREKKTPRGVEKEYGPFVYGYSVTVGPDGKPVIREFGNVKPRFGSAGRPALQIKSEREPVVDVIDEEKKIRVVAELPGVQKEDINLDCTDDRLTIQVETERRKYFKEIGLPKPVIASSAKATYTNGVLEVSLDKIEPASKSGRTIRVD
jgi:HSP20 family protein